MRSVYRSKSHQNMIDTLIGRTGKDSDTEVAVFPTIKALQCYAAMLGFERGESKEFTRGRHAENIEWHVFASEGHDQYIYLIALAETGDVAILKGDTENSEAKDKKFSDDDMVKIFEEYAEGGFQIMQEWLNKKPEDIYGNEAVMQGLKKAGLLKEPLVEEEFDDPRF